MRFLTFAGLLLLTGIAIPQSPVRPTHHSSQRVSGREEVPVEQAADAYAIYSLLTPGPLLLSRQAGTQRWAIAEQTVNAQDMNPRIDPRGALKPPPGGEIQFHQAVATFLAARDIRYRLQPRLHLDRPYDLLTPEQVHDLRSALASPSPGSRIHSRYAVYPGVTLFSGVYFDAQHNTALVYRSEWCGSLCGQAQWIYLEKQNGQWKQISGITRPGA